MSAVARFEAPQKLMLFEHLAAKYALTVDDFVATVKAVCGLRSASMAEVGAFLMVARQYELNPVLKEIYAFPAKGGGIVPIVSIDGWVNLVNSHKACDGFEFDFEHAPNGDLIACTCRMYRKDRGRPVTVTEYLSECVRTTEPWKMKHRMLRHKAMIQAARYAFGFSGIYDEDEGAKIAEGAMQRAGVVTLTPPNPDEPAQIEHQSESVAVTATVDAGASSTVQSGPASSSSPDTPEEFRKWAVAHMSEAKDANDLAAIWEAYIEPHGDNMFPPDKDDLMEEYRKIEKSFQ